MTLRPTRPTTSSVCSNVSHAALSFVLRITYLGLCCGAGPHHIRSLAEAIGHQPPASRYSPDMSKHAFLSTDSSLKKEYQEYAPRL